MYETGRKAPGEYAQPLGRWPANVILDEEAGQVLDAQSGNRPGMSGGGKHKPGSKGGMFGAIDCEHTARGDSGGASRFFYCAKVSSKERNAGLEHLPARQTTFASGTGLSANGDGTARNQDATARNQDATARNQDATARNHHPTLKPIDLTRYLARLILPPTEAPRLLVPFSGTGSEMIGAMLAGWSDVTGIEGEAEYIEIAHARIAHWIATRHAQQQLDLAGE